MTEWGVVGVIVVLVGLFTGICVPFIKATTKSTEAMTRLTVSVENLTSKIEKLDSSNTIEHDRLWDYNDEQDKTLKNHEIRIVTLEQKGGDDLK